MSYNIMSTLKNCTARQLRLQKTRVGTTEQQTNVKDRAQSSRSKRQVILASDSLYVCNFLKTNLVFSVKLHKCIYFLGIALMFPTSVYFSSVNRSLVDDPNCHGIAQRCDLPVYCPVDLAIK